MLNRRDLLKSLGIAGVTIIVPKFGQMYRKTQHSVDEYLAFYTTDINPFNYTEIHTRHLIPLIDNQAIYQVTRAEFLSPHNAAIISKDKKERPHVLRVGTSTLCFGDEIHFTHTKRPPLYTSSEGLKV